MSVELHHGDCITVLSGLEDNSVDTAVMDPPAGISFMGKKWDNKTGYVAKTDKGMRFLEFGELMGLEPWEAGFVAFMIDVLIETYRVMKPGAMCLVWALPRTADLTGLAMRVAGLEVRDAIAHIFGSGFPKSHDLSKAIDRGAGAEREKIGTIRKSIKGMEANGQGNWCDDNYEWKEEFPITAPATESAKLWHGWGTALKPAYESWLLGMKPIDGTFANNALVHGCAGLWIDGARIPGESWGNRPAIKLTSKGKKGGGFGQTAWETIPGQVNYDKGKGRFPSNLILSHHPECRQVGTKRVKTGDKAHKKGTRGAAKFDGKYNGGERYENARDCIGGYADPDGYETIPAWECVEGCPIRELGEQSGTLTSGARTGPNPNASRALSDAYDGGWKQTGGPCNSSTGTAARYFLNLPGEARFFYCAKSSRAERNLGLEGMEKRKRNATNFDGAGGISERIGEDGKRTPKATRTPESNHHPTVKPLALMKYLCTLTRTPTGGVVLDPFMGSGTTGVACVHTGRDFIGIERDAEYFEIAQRRIEHAQNETVQLELLEATENDRITA